MPKRKRKTPRANYKALFRQAADDRSCDARLLVLWTFEGREVPSVPARDGARPYGWRVNGIGELIDAIDQNSR